MNNGGGEDRTRLSQIMSLVHSPDCYTPKGIHVIFITLNFNIQYKNNISKNTSLGSFCEISFFLLIFKYKFNFYKWEIFLKNMIKIKQNC